MDYRALCGKVGAVVQRPGGEQLPEAINNGFTRAAGAVMAWLDRSVFDYSDNFPQGMTFAKISLK
jgi:hypothetical protein